MRRHLIHLICGATGAGKTTYATQLAERLGGIRFSIDEWMEALFWADSPRPLDAAWSMNRVDRCYAQIWRVARAVAGRDVPCVLDLGFGRAESRRHFAALARDAGLATQLHFIDATPEQRWCRVEQRNAEKGETYQLGFDVTREMFDFVEGLWEPPDEAEMLACDGVRIAAR